MASSRTLREQVAQAIYQSDRRSYSADPEWDELDEKDEYRANAGAAIRVVLAAATKQIEAERWPQPDEPNSRIADDVHGWRAYRSHEKAIDAALAVVTRLEAVSNGE